MKSAVLVVGLLLATTGCLTFALPGRLRALLEWFTVSNRVLLAVLGRLALGLVLLLGAYTTRWPAVAIALGLVFLAGGAAIPVLGEERVGRIVAWWLGRSDWALRSWSAVVFAVGGLVIWLAS